MKDLKTLFGISSDTKISEKEGLKNALMCCDSVGDMLRLLLARYDLDNCKPGAIVKNTLVSGLVTAFDMLKPKEK
jgi:hypothetical protein